MNSQTKNRPPVISVSNFLNAARFVSKTYLYIRAGCLHMSLEGFKI